MNQREITIRLCEAYIKAGRTVDISDVIKIANYIIEHTSTSTPYYAAISTIGLNTASEPYTYTTTCDTGSNVMSASDALQESITL